MSAQYYTTAPCPNCGAPNGARMGSTLWGHNHPCCSDECGEAFATSKKRYVIELMMAELRLTSALHEVEGLKKVVAELEKLADG